MNRHKSQSGSSHFIIVIVLLLALTGALGYIFWQNYTQSKTVASQTGNTTDASKQISESELETIASNELDVFTSKTAISQLNNQEKLQLAIKLYEKDNPLADGVYTRTFSADDLDTVFNKTSISSLGIIHENVKCIAIPTHDQWQFDSNTQTYSDKNHGGHGIASSVYPMFSKKTNFTAKDGQYSISYKYVFGLTKEFGFGDDSIFGTYLNAKNNTNPVHIFKATDESTLDPPISVDGKVQMAYIADNYDSFKDKLSTYIYHFTKTNGKISLVAFNIE